MNEMRFEHPAAVNPVEEQRALIALSLVPGVGPGRIRSLIARFGTAMEVMGAPRALLAGVSGMGPQTALAIARFEAYEVVDAQVRQAEQLSATLITSWDTRFPRLLREIYDPPAFLWARGDLVAQDDRTIAIVGTRKATDYGRRVAYDFGATLARRGFTVVSGLAYGIDAAAHRGAIEAGGRTLAVLGSGVDRIYPARHTRLAERIAGQGALLSEYPLGAAPDAPNFPRRNRIVSGLSLGTLVVEAYQTGGALITARLALEQNREVFAIPGSLHSKASEGVNHLIQQGYAKLVLSVDEVVEELGGAADSAPARVQASPEPELNDIEAQLLGVLDEEPRHIDLICTDTALDVSTVLVYLLSLEFKGLVRQMGGKQFYRVS